MNCKKCGHQLEYASQVCPQCGSTNVDASAETKKQEIKKPEIKKPEIGMKWYKFLIYFLLFASAVGNGLSAIGAFALVGMGGAYYLIQAFMSIALLIMALCARSGLAKHQQSGPKTLGAMYITNAVYTAANTLISFAIVGYVENTLLIRMILTVVGIMVMYSLNKVYFNKRKKYFLH